MAEPTTVGAIAWHAVPAAETVQVVEVDSRVGLSSSEAATRLARHGPNRLAEAPREQRWRAFLRPWFFTTADLPSGQWLARAAVGSTILVAGKTVKAVARAGQRRSLRGSRARAA